MKKVLDFEVRHAELPGPDYALLRLRPALEGAALPPIEPGQFVQVLTRAQGVTLRRPISVNRVTPDGELWLLVRKAGRGTAWMAALRPGDTVNLLLPLGRGWTLHTDGSPTLLAGGGVGVAPLLALGDALAARGVTPTFLLGARTASGLLELDAFRRLGPVYVSTDDGSAGHPGVITQNPVMQQPWSHIHCCGPMPMMRAVATLARDRGIDCEVSLENNMACGMGACLCCVEPTTTGNRCVCTDGPVFNISELTWQTSK